MRQIGKQVLTLAVGAMLAVPAFAQAESARIVTDPLTGVALDGYDVVSYFASSEPRQGSPEFEYVWAGVPWYFASAANRDAFLRHPEVYVPQYGGHGAMAMGRGYVSQGRPGIYLVDADRLYLFYSTGNREAFRLGLPKSIEDADTNWARLSPELGVVPEVGAR